MQRNVNNKKILTNLDKNMLFCNKFICRPFDWREEDAFIINR